MAKQKPLIALTLDTQQPRGSHDLRVGSNFIECVKAAGGLPVLVPWLSPEDTRQFVDMIDGLILNGGYDVPPHIYGAKPHSKTKPGPVSRAKFELRLIQEVLRQHKPILGICYGHQLLNITFGGTLMQHIPTDVPGALEHRSFRGTNTRHTVRMQPGLLRTIFGKDRVMTQSRHHQAVMAIGTGVRAVGHASDGIIEATEFATTQFVASVQWHPESSPHSRATQRLFKALVQAAATPPRGKHDLVRGQLAENFSGS